MVVPVRAAVRPRVYLSQSSETVPLESEILSTIEASDADTVWLMGPVGSGKSTALQHLAATLPAEANVRLFDRSEPKAEDTAGGGVAVYALRADVALDVAFPGKSAAAARELGRTRFVILRMADWGEDEWIEYLLATQPDACGSVMRRLKLKLSVGWLGGNPQLWRAVLDEMAADESLVDPREALRRRLASTFSSKSELRAAQGGCLARCLRRDTREFVPLGKAPKKYWSGVADGLLRHRPALVLLAAEQVHRDLAKGELCEYLREPFSRRLTEEVATLIAWDARAIEELKQHFVQEDRRYQPSTASILLGADAKWRPADGSASLLVEADLHGAQWPGLLLSHVDADRCDFSSADLSCANLSHANATSANFMDANLAHALLQRLDAPGANFSGACLEAAKAEEAVLQGCDFAGADLCHIRLQNAILFGANLTGALFRGADLRGATISASTIADADFTKANFQGAMLARLPLRMATLDGARFVAADLQKCDLEEVVLEGCDFSYADLRGAMLTGSRIPDTNFSRADLREAGLANVQWLNANLRGADLTWASFHLGSTRSGLVDSPIACEGSRTGFYTDDYNDQDFKSPEEIRKADLRGADLREAILDGVDFYLVDLRGAHYDAQQALHLRRCGAIL